MKLMLEQREAVDRGTAAAEQAPQTGGAKLRIYSGRREFNAKLLDIAQANTMAGMNFVSELTADGGFLSYGRGALRAISYPGPGDECAAFPIHPLMLRHACLMPW